MSENKGDPNLGPLYVGAQNDALFIIDKPPRPSNDYPQHDAEVAAIAKIYHSGIPGREKAFADLFASAPETKAQRDELLTAAKVADDALKAAMIEVPRPAIRRKITRAQEILRAAIRMAQGGGDK